MDLDKLSQMTNHITNSLMAHLSNELYFDYRETSDETAAFEEFMLEHVKPSLENEAKAFIQLKQFEAEQKDLQTKLDNIVEALQKWRRERRLSKDLQKASLLGNVLEELSELARAKTSDERVDALCDVCVFAINACNEPLCYVYTASYDLNDKNALFAFITMAMQDVQYDNLSHLVYTCLSIVKQLGYEPFKAMQETIKEISSRTGKWDEKLGKFVKDNGVYNEASLLKKFETDIRALHPDENVVFEYRDNEVDVNIDYGKSIYTYKLWHKADYEQCKES